MVSSLTSRLFACSRNSNSSTTCSGSSGHKRRLETSGQSVRPDSLSGYSADREDSSSSPPFSIDVSNGTTHDNMREMNNCPKRQRRNELQFAASSVKADLARAGYEFSTVDPMKESTTMLSSATINLKGVKLVHSKSFQKMPIITTGAVAGSPYDYQALALACFESYPSNYSGSTLSNQEVASSQDSDRSTSSVSESDTDSVTSKGNSDDFPGMMIPPLFQEESEEAYMERPRESNSCHVVSSESSAITMSETMTLTTTPR